MRINPEHADKIERAITRDDDGNARVALSPAVMRQAMGRLNLWERGLVMEAIMRAASAKRPTKDQRALLALFLHADAEASHAQG